MLDLQGAACTSWHWCEAIADTVTQHADGLRVTRVDVRIGQFRQVVPDLLQFSWQLLTGGTDLEGCVLAVEHVPAVAECRVCGRQTVLSMPILICAACDSSDIRLVTGEELQISSIDRTEEVS